MTATMKRITEALENYNLAMQQMCEDDPAENEIRREARAHLENLLAGKRARSVVRHFRLPLATVAGRMGVLVLVNYKEGWEADYAE
jgi:hypothetical protein